MHKSCFHYVISSKSDTELASKYCYEDSNMVDHKGNMSFLKQRISSCPLNKGSAIDVKIDTNILAPMKTPIQHHNLRFVKFIGFQLIAYLKKVYLKLCIHVFKQGRVRLG